MEIKINVNINLANFNQIIDKLSQLSSLPSREEQKIEFNENIDITKLREKIAELTSTGKLAVVQEMLKKYNAKKLIDVNEKDYESLYKDIIKQIN